jgi:hypothetical protein
MKIKNPINHIVNLVTIHHKYYNYIKIINLLKAVNLDIKEIIIIKIYQKQIDKKKFRNNNK